MFNNTLAYNKARIELHAQALAYEKATGEERENLPIGKLIPQEDVTDELWSLLNSLPIEPVHPIQPPTHTYTHIDMSKLAPSLPYNKPKVGLKVTEDNLEWFIQTYSEWFLRVGFYGKLRDRDGDCVGTDTLIQGQYLPYVVIRKVDS